MDKNALMQMYDERSRYNGEGADFELFRLTCYMAGRALVANYWADDAAREPVMAKDTVNLAVARMFISSCDYIANELAEEGKSVDTVRYAMIKAIQEIKSAAREIGISINFKEGQRSSQADNVVFEVAIKYGERLANTDLWVNVSQDSVIDEIFKEMSSLLYHILKVMGKDIGTPGFKNFKERVTQILNSLLNRELALKKQT